jgi:hypothetical protein
MRRKSELYVGDTTDRRKWEIAMWVFGILVLVMVVWNGGYRTGRIDQMALTPPPATTIAP